MQDRIYKYIPLWGEYIIEDKIGEGSLGSVYKVFKFEKSKKIIQSVKIITIPTYAQIKLKEEMNNEEFVKYCKDIVEKISNEIEALQKIDSYTNILKYDEYFVEYDQINNIWDIIIKMEYATSISSYTKDRILTPLDIIKLGIEICTALEISHNKKIINCDIKEDNIFKTSSGIYKLGDLGVTKKFHKISNLDYSQNNFVPPEVISGKEYDSRSNIYSLGVILFKFFNKYYSNGKEEILKEIYYEFLSKNNEVFQNKILKFTWNNDVIEVLKKACSASLENRYDNISEMKHDLVNLFQKLLMSCNKVYLNNGENQKKLGKTKKDNKIQIILGLGIFLFLIIIIIMLIVNNCENLVLYLGTTR